MNYVKNKESEGFYISEIRRMLATGKRLEAKKLSKKLENLRQRKSISKKENKND